MSIKAGAVLVFVLALGAPVPVSLAQQPAAPAVLLAGEAILTMMEGIWGTDCSRGDVVRQIIRRDNYIMVHREARTTLEIVTSITGNVVATCAVEGGTAANECFRYTVLPDRIIADYITRGVALWERCDPPRA